MRRRKAASAKLKKDTSFVGVFGHPVRTTKTLAKAHVKLGKMAGKTIGKGAKGAARVGMKRFHSLRRKLF
jgi:hypothetical protein